MPNQRNVSLSEGCKRYDEAIRAIPKYLYNAEKEPNALLDPALDKLNGVYYINPCMGHKKGARHISKKLEAFYKQKTNKDAKTNTQICTAIVTMPKDFIMAHYDLEEKEYVLLDKYFQEKEIDSDELLLVKAIKEKLVHIRWTKEELDEIHMFFKAAQKAYCIAAGIKGCKVTYALDENGKPRKDKNGRKIVVSEDYTDSDILWSISHVSESWPHLHLGFLPMSYVQDTKKAEKYEQDKSERNAKIEELVASGMSQKEAIALHPAVPKPFAMNGDLDREIDMNEKATGCTVKRFNKGYLYKLNATLERRMAEEGFAVHIANGAGGKFDVQKQKREKRFEQSTDEKAFKALLLEKEKLEKKNSQLNQENVHLKEKTATVSCRLLVLQDELDEKQNEISRKDECIAQLQDYIKSLNEELMNLLEKVRTILPRIISKFLTQWEKAKTISEMNRIDEEAKGEIHFRETEANRMIDKLEEKADAILKVNEIVNGINMDTFLRTDNTVEVAKQKILKRAEAIGLSEVFSNGYFMELALMDWFNKEKHRAKLEKLSEVDARLYMQSVNRAELAIEYALERAEELEEEC